MTQQSRAPILFSDLIENKKEHDSRAVVITSSLQNLVDLELSSGEILRRVNLVGAASVGDIVTLRYTAGTYTALATGTGSSGAGSVFIFGAGGSGGSGVYAPSPHDLLGSHHTLPNLSQSMFLASPIGTGGSPSFRAIGPGDLPGGFSGFGNPTSAIGLSVVNGSATTAMRSDAAPALDVSISPTWTAAHLFNNTVGINDLLTVTKTAEQLRLRRDAGNYASFTVGATGDLTVAPTGANVILPNAKALSTPTFNSGFAGAGYRLDQNISTAGQTSLELDNLIVRGTMRVYELLIQQIRATNGSVYVTSSAKLATVVDNGGGSYTCTVDANTSDYQPFAVGDLIRAQRVNLGTTTVVWRSDLTVTAINVSGNQRAFTAALRSGTTVPATGMEFVRLGSTSDANRRGGVYLTADDSNAPFIDIVDGVDSWTAWNSAGAIKARLGRLSGITDPFFGTLSGYGIYTNHAYLNNAFINGSLVIGPGIGFSVPAILYCAFDTAPGSNITNTNGHLGQAATITGTGVLGQPGKFGGGVAVSDAATNGCSNPSFETNITGWAVVNNGTGATIAIAQSPERAWIGSKSLKCVATGASTYLYTQARVQGPASSFAWNIGGNPTLSAYVLVESGTWRVIFEDSSQNFRAYTDLTASSNWQRVQALVVNTFGTNYPSVRVSIMPIATGTCYVDGVLYDNYGALRPYCDTSVTAGALGYSVVMPATWTIMCWAYRNSYQARNYGYLWYHSNDYASIFYNSSNVDVVGGTIAAAPSNGWHHYAITYDGTNLRSYRDGALVGTFSSSYTKAQSIYVGGQSGGNQFNGEIDDFAVVSRQLSADELTIIYNSAAPLNVTRSNYELLLTDPSTTARVVGNAAGIFGTDASAKPTFSLVNVTTAVNGETLDPGDVLIGDNSSGKANMLFDQSAGRLNLRGGTTTQAYIDTTGAFVAGNIKLDASGLSIPQGDSITPYSPSKAIRFVDSSSNTRTNIYSYLGGSGHTSVLETTTSALQPTGQGSGVALYAQNSASYYAQLSIWSGDVYNPPTVTMFGDRPVGFNLNGDLTVTGSILTGARVPRSSGAALYALDSSSAGSSVTLANNATTTPLGSGVALRGLLMVWSQSDGVGALMFADAGAPAIVSDRGGIFSTAAGTANKINVYVAGGALTIENKRGASTTISVIAWRLA